MRDHEQPGPPGELNGHAGAPADTAAGKGNVLTHPGTIAAAVFIAASALALLVAHLTPYGGDAGARSTGLPLAAGALGALVLAPLAFRRPTPWLAGATAGSIGAWLVLIFATALRGTPFPFFGLLGDSGRLTAMATRYSVTAASADPWIRGLPGEYPPLFPWTVGRVSALLDVPAWKLVGLGEAVFTGAAVVLGFILWLRLLKPWQAIAVTLMAFMIFAIPAKAYEAITLMAFAPWVIGTFGNPPRGRLHWFASGLVGGFLILTYYGWLVLGGIGVAILAVATFRREANRRAFVFYLLKVFAVAFVLSSWFVVPLAIAKLTGDGANVSDLYGSSSLLDQMLPFLDLTWIGLTQLVGLVGLIWLRGRVWWAWPLLTLVIGAYAFRLFGAIVFVLTNHTLIAHYTRSIYMSVLLAAGVLTLVHAVPLLVKRLSLNPPHNAAAMVLALLIGWAGFTITMDWTPGLQGRYSDYVERAYREPLPDGTYPADVANPTPWFPVGPIQREVERVKGADARPVVLSNDERLFSFLPWYGYIGTDIAASSMSLPYERLAEVEKLAGTRDPAAFTSLSRSTRFGEIDVFALQKESAQAWTWTFNHGFGQTPTTFTFTPDQFSTADWEVVEVPQSVIVVIRKHG
jgi:hypothetical protein